MARLFAAFAFFLLLQIGFWWETLDHKPRMEIVPNVPSATAVKALSFGDEEAYFRMLGMELQTFGDTFGRFTPLREYDFARLERWFHLLDTLDNTSDYIPTMASYYFSQTQNTPDVQYVVNYLRDHSEGRLDTKWWWRAQAVYLANHKLNDTQQALELALPLVETKNVPAWVNQLAAFMYEKQGEFESAYHIMQEVQKNADHLDPGELRFMEYFIKERLGALEKKLDAGEAPTETTP